MEVYIIHKDDKLTYMMVVSWNFINTVAFSLCLPSYAALRCLPKWRLPHEVEVIQVGKVVYFRKRGQILGHGEKSRQRYEKNHYRGFYTHFCAAG